MGNVTGWIDFDMQWTYRMHTKMPAENLHRAVYLGMRLAQKT